MKRITFLLIIIAFTFLALTIAATKNYAIEDKHLGHSHAQDQGQKPAVMVDGSKDSSKIPDNAAQEILFHLLSTTDPEEEKIEQRKSAYLRVAGFTVAEAAAISNAAYEYKKEIEPLDKQVDDIKNAHWPNPTSAVMSQLAELQRQKETIIGNKVKVLKDQLKDYDASKFDKHILNDIKKKTKGFGAALPNKKVSSLGKFFSNFFSVSAQSCDFQTYIYSSTVEDLDNLIIYGNSSWSMPYNNCNHTITMTTTMGGITTASGNNGAYISLDGGNDIYYDGYVQTFSDADAFCPVANTNTSAGSNSSDYTAAPFLTVKPFGNFNPNPVNRGHGAFISYVVIASQHAQGSFSTELSYDLVAGSTSVVGMSGGGTHYFGNGAAVTVLCEYLLSDSLPGTFPVKIKAVADNSSSTRFKNASTIMSSSILVVTY